jgi:hypothetical protein
MKKIVMEILKSRSAVRIIAAVIALSFFAGTYHAAQAQAEETGVLRHFKRGEKLPPIELSVVKDAAKHTFLPGTGKPSVIMFFSIRPDFRKKRSLALLSTLSDLAEQYKNRLDIVGVFSDSKQLDTVRTFINKSAIYVRVFNDRSKKIYNEYGVFMMPLVVLAGSDGALHEVIPYTYNMKRIVEGNIKYLLGELDKDQLVKTLKPKEKELKSDKEKEYIRRINYGRIMFGKKMYGQSVREFSTAVKLMPKLIEAHVDLGFALLATKKYDKAEESFREALKINAESDDAISGLGLSYYKRGEKELAFTELEKAFIAPNPRLEVIIALAEMYEEKGFDDKANRLNKLAISRLMTMYEQRWK